MPSGQCRADNAERTMPSGQCRADNAERTMKELQ
jgi:hypothetical protein